MTDPTMRDRAVALYDAFTHEHRDRRRLLRELAALAGGIAAAEALVGTISASPAAAAIVAADDPRLVTREGGYRLADGSELTGYFAAPRRAAGRVGAVMVIHENRGLTPHIEDVARRVALAGFFAVAPDFLSRSGGTPADEDRAREMIGALDYDRALADGVATVARLRGLRNGTGKVGAVGFCWGGAYVNRLALAAGRELSAGVAYYGPAPAASEAAKVEVPLLLHYAEKDARVAATGTPWVAALKAAERPVTAYTYPGVDHAFNNDTSAARYDKVAAELAWGRTTAFLREHLAA